MKIRCSTPAYGEARLVHLFKEVGPNVQAWGEDNIDTHLKRPIDQGNYPKAIAGAGMVIASTVFELGDALISGAVDRKVAKPGPEAMSRTRRDLGALFDDATHFRVLPVVADVLRLPGSFVMDVPTTALSFDRGPQSIASRVRNQSADVLRN